MAYAENDGVKIYWEEQGEGDPLLLIMGLGYTLEMWYRIAPVLAEHYRVITFDNRGVGRTDVPEGPYPIPTMAGDAMAVLDAAGIDRAHVLGASLGGLVAQEVALLYPERVRALILACTHPGLQNAIAASDEVMEKLRARGSMPAEQGVRLMIPHIYDSSTPRERIEEDLEIRMRTYPTEQGYTAQVAGALTWEGYDRLPSIKAPTLVLQGENDELVPPENARVIAEQIPGAELAIIPNASHIFMTDATDESNKAVLGFLADK